MNSRYTFVYAFSIFCIAAINMTQAESYKILPDSINLTRSGETHRLIVESFDGELGTGDLTSDAELVSSDEPTIVDSGIKPIYELF